MPRSLLEGACLKETQENNETMMKEAVGLREEAGEGGCGSWSDSRQVRCVHHEVAVRVYS